LLPIFLRGIYAVGQYIELAPGAIALAAFHSTFIAIGALVVLPFTDRFASLVERLVPGRTTQPEHHLDASQLGVPEVALHTVQRTLVDTSTRLIAHYTSLLQNSLPDNTASVLSNMEQTLHETYEFAARIQLPLDDEYMLERRSAQLHAVDHLLRLLGRVRSMCEHAEQLQETEYREARELATHLAGTATSGLSHNTPDTWLQDLQNDASAQADLMHTARQSVLAGKAFGDKASDALRTTDVYRWFERTGRHIWRICLYLNESADRSGATS